MKKLILFFGMHILVVLLLMAFANADTAICRGGFGGNASAGMIRQSAASTNYNEVVNNPIRLTGGEGGTSQNWGAYYNVTQCIQSVTAGATLNNVTFMYNATNTQANPLNLTIYANTDAYSMTGVTWNSQIGRSRRLFTSTSYTQTAGWTNISFGNNATALAWFQNLSDNRATYPNLGVQFYEPQNTNQEIQATAQVVNGYYFWFISYTTGAGAQTASFVAPTPADGARNNTNIILNITSTNNRTTLWFGNTSNLTNAHRVLDNVSMSNAYQLYYANFTTEGTYYYKAAADSTANTTLRSFIYDVTAPTITLDTDNGFTTSNISRVNQYTSQILPINITVTGSADLYAFLINITNPSGTSVYDFNTTSLSGSRYNFNRSVNHSTWASNTLYTITIAAGDSHTNQKIKDYGVSKSKSKLQYATEEGNNIEVSSDELSNTETVKTKDRYDFRFNFDSKGKKARTINVKSDKPITYLPNSQYPAHFVIYDKKTNKGNWIDFAGSSSSFVVQKVSDYHYKVVFSSLEDEITFKSIGGLNTNTVRYTWYKGSYSIVAPSQTSGIPFSLLMNLGRGGEVSDAFAGITYNGTVYVPNKTNYSGSSNFSADIAAQSVNVTTLHYFSWNITVRQSDASSYSFFLNSSLYMYPFILDNCSSGNMPTATFSIFKEDYPTQALNGTLEIDGEYTVNGSQIAQTINLEYPSNSVFNLCLFPNSTTIYGTLYLKYDVPAGFTHRWYFYNESFTNTSQSISLYNYNYTTGVSQLKITTRYQDSYQYFLNVIAKLQRRYLPEGVWRTVQMDRSGDYGLMTFNIQERDIDYRLIFLDTNNNILNTGQSIKFLCSSSLCDITQLLVPYSASAGVANTTVQLSFANTSRIVTGTWNVPSGDSVNFTQKVTKETGQGSIVICEASSVGSSGTSNCNVTGYIGTVRQQVLVDGVIVGSRTYDTATDKLFNIQSKQDSVIYSLVIMIPIVMVGLFSPVLTVITTIIALFIIYFTGMLNAITLTVVIIAAVMGIAIALKVKN